METAGPEKKKLSFFSVLFTFFVDNLGWSIVFPIFAPFFLDVHNEIFSSDVSVTTRTSLFGIFLAAFPFAQFIGAPILGEIADKFGRKKAFVYSIFLSFVGYVFCAWAIYEKHLVYVFVSRIISGLFSGNLSICLATISDLSRDKKHKLKNFSNLSVIGGLSFIVGTFIGGKFSDETASHYFSAYLPLLIAAGLCFINLLFMIFAFVESFHINKDLKFDFLESVHNIRDALRTEKIKIVYVIYFLFVFAWTIIFQFSPVMVIEKFHFTNSQIGDLAALMGICWAIGSGGVHKILVKIFPSLRVLEVTLFVFTALAVVITFQNNLWGTITLLSLCGVVGGIAWPICTALISNLASNRIQGKIMGMSQSMQSLAMVVSPLIGGFSDQLYHHLPFILAGVASFIGGIIYFRIKF